MKHLEITLRAVIAVPEDVDKLLCAGDVDAYTRLELDLLHRLQARRVKIDDITDNPSPAPGRWSEVRRG